MPNRGHESGRRSPEMVALQVWKFQFVCPEHREEEIRELLTLIGTNKLQIHTSSEPFIDGGSGELLGRIISGSCHPDIETNILRTLLDAEVWTRIRFTTAQKKLASNIVVSDTHKVSIGPELRELLD